MAAQFDITKVPPSCTNAHDSTLDLAFMNNYKIMQRLIQDWYSGPSGGTIMPPNCDVELFSWDFSKFVVPDVGVQFQQQNMITKLFRVVADPGYTKTVYLSAAIGLAVDEIIATDLTKLQSTKISGSTIKDFKKFKTMFPCALKKVIEKGVSVSTGKKSSGPYMNETVQEHIPEFVDNDGRTMMTYAGPANHTFFMKLEQSPTGTNSKFRITHFDSNHWFESERKRNSLVLRYICASYLFFVKNTPDDKPPEWELPRQFQDEWINGTLFEIVCAGCEFTDGTKLCQTSDACGHFACNHALAELFQQFMKQNSAKVQTTTGSLIFHFLATGDALASVEHAIRPHKFTAVKMQKIQDIWIKLRASRSPVLGVPSLSSIPLHATFGTFDGFRRIIRDDEQRLQVEVLKGNKLLKFMGAILNKNRISFEHYSALNGPTNDTMITSLIKTRIQQRRFLRTMLLPTEHNNAFIFDILILCELYGKKVNDAMLVFRKHGCHAPHLFHVHSLVLALNTLLQKKADHVIEIIPLLMRGQLSIVIKYVSTELRSTPSKRLKSNKNSANVVSLKTDYIITEKLLALVTYSPDTTNVLQFPIEEQLMKKRITTFCSNNYPGLTLDFVAFEFPFLIWRKMDVAEKQFITAAAMFYLMNIMSNSFFMDDDKSLHLSVSRMREFFGEFISVSEFLYHHILLDLSSRLAKMP